MKKFKKLPKKIISIMLVTAVIFNYFYPLTKVFADEGYVLTFSATGEHIMEDDGGHLKIDGQYVDLRDGNDHTIGEVNCTSNKACTITMNEDIGGSLNYNSDQKFTLYMQGHPINMGFNFSANENIAVQDYEPEEHGVEPGPEPGERFDGRATVVWSCGTGICYHEFDVVNPETCDPEHDMFEGCDPEIGNFDDGNSTFFKDTEIEADNKPGTTFNVHAEYRGWYLTDELNKWKDLYEIATGNPVNWNTLEPEIILGEPKQPRELEELEEEAIGAHACTRPAHDALGDERKEFEDCTHLYAAQKGEIWTHKLQPVGEPNDNNAFVSYGDRNFKVVIYNENFKGITTGDLTGLNYYPTHWADPFLRTDQYDVSNTNKDNPTLLESILLENTINIDVLPYNNYEIDTIEALDVPEEAVTITKINSHKFQLVFSSNFYDHVVFKITDTNNEKSYIQVKRYTIDAWIRDGNTLSADFYFDKEKSYEEFELTAKIIYNDGTVENVTLEAVEGFRDGLGNPVEGFEFNEYEAGGKGLKRSVFEHYIAEGADKTIKDIYLNAEYKGSDANTYAGAYAGSGEGTPANLYHPEEGGE